MNPQAKADSACSHPREKRAGPLLGASRLSGGQPVGRVQSEQKNRLGAKLENIPVRVQ